MSQQDKNQLRKWIALAVIVIGLIIFVVRVAPPASPRVPPSPESQPLIIGFVIFAFGAGLVRRHPRFAALHTSRQYTLDSLLFFLYLCGLPLLVWMLFNNPRWPKIFVDILFWISITIPVLLFGGHYIILPAIYQEKRYVIYHLILDKLQQLFPRNANLYITRGNAYYAQGEFNKAIKAAEQALHLIPPMKTDQKGKFAFKDWRVINAHNLRMQSYFSLAQPELALDDAEALVRIYPSEPIHYFNHSLAARGADDFETANADLEHISQMKLEPLQKAFLALSQADLASQQGKTEEGHKLYQTVLTVPLTTADQRQFVHATVYGELSLLELRRNNEDAAFEMAKKSESINPNMVSTGLAFIYAQRGEWDKAVSQWRRLTTIAPRFGQKDIMRRQYRRDPEFVDLMEQILARLDIPSEPPETPVSTSSSPSDS
jgi:tetratricopeptide (TPR) repeat protein